MLTSYCFGPFYGFGGSMSDVSGEEIMMYTRRWWLVGLALLGIVLGAILISIGRQ